MRSSSSFKSLDSFTESELGSSGQKESQKRHSVLQRKWTATLATKPEVADARLDGRYQLSGRTGSLMYMAPEVFKSEPYNEKVSPPRQGPCCERLYTSIARA